MQIQKENRIGDIVAQNFHSAKVFENLGLDFCCGGKKSISDACNEKGLNTDYVISELSKIDEGSAASYHYANWELDFLVDYIINNHHSYVVNSSSTIMHHLQKVVEAHGQKHPELAEINRIFAELKEELSGHMEKEEKMLFPYIKRLCIASKNSLEISHPPFGKVENPVKVMEAEHESAGKMLAEINKLSSSYTPPAGACGTYKVLYAELKEFEQDLHVHVHIENNILFPRAVALENRLNLTQNKLIH